MSGWSWICSLGNDQMPPNTSARNIMITGMGFRIDHVTKFMGLPQRAGGGAGRAAAGAAGRRRGVVDRDRVPVLEEACALHRDGLANGNAAGDFHVVAMHADLLH